MSQNVKILELSPQQIQAIELMMTGQKQADIARQIDVVGETISRWKADPAFIAALNQAKVQRWDAITNNLDNLVVDALEALMELLHHKDARMRLAAIKVILANRSTPTELMTEPGQIEKQQREAALFEDLFSVA